MMEQNVFDTTSWEFWW